MRQSSLAKVGDIYAVSISIDREIASRYDDVKIVADNIDDVVAVASAAATTAAVATSIGVVTAVGSNIDAVVDVHNNTANIATIIDNFTNMNTVASNIADVSDVANSIEAVDTVNENMTNIHTTVANIVNVGVVAGNITGVNIVASGMADILTASSNIADMIVAADNIAQINQVAADTAQINEIVATVVPNMAEILLADDRAATATSMAATATTARVAAEVAQGIAETKAAEAELSASAADVSADLAATSADVASAKASEAGTSASAAHASELAAAALLDAFDDIYLGAYADNPLVDNDGNPLVSGALYFNNVAHNLRVYDAGMAEWIALAVTSFADMRDVLLTSVSTGDMLKWNGSKWINTSPQTTITGNAGTATKLQTARAIQLSGAVTGTADFDGDAAINIVTTHTADPVITLAGDATGSVTLTNLSSGTLTVNIVDDSHNHVISNIDGLQTAIDAKVDDTEKGVANGIATLDANGKVVLSQINDSILGQLEYKGVWNFATMPTATEKGQYWIASVAGNGYEVGDWAVYNGVTFDKVDNTDAVSSVAGRTGVVVLTKTDVGLGNVDNTADSAKNVLYSTTAGAVTGQGALATLSSVNASTITDNSVGAAELNVTGNGTTSQYLRSDGDGTFTWATPTDTSTTYTAGTGLSLTGTVFANTSPNVSTNLTYTTATTTGSVNSSDGTSATIPAATTSLAGLMTNADKSKLDGVATGANNYVHPTSDGSLHVPATSTTNNGKVLTAGATAGSLSWTTPTVGTVTAVSGTLPIVSSGGATPSISIPAATAAVSGYMSSTYASKLDGVETGATADQTASEILTAIKTVDGSDSGLDADLLDGNHASAFSLTSHTHSYEAPITAGTTAQYYRGDKTWQTLNATAVGLGNVTNAAQMTTAHAANAITGLATTTTSLSSGGTGVQGTSTVIARADHTHTLPAYPTTLPASDVYAWAKASVKPSYIFSEIGTKPTTLSGYGITDASLSTHTHNYAGSSSAGGAATTALACTGNAATATNVAYSGLTGTVPIWNQSTTGDLIGSRYISGGLEKPDNTLFGAGKLRYQMLSSTNLGTGVGVWNDVLWISSYTGSDVKGSNALIMSKDNDYVGVSRSNYDATVWSAPKQLAYTSSNITGSSGSVVNSSIIKFDTGTTEGTNLYTFNGSTAKTIDIKAGTNVSLTKAAGVITISSTDTNTVYSHPAGDGNLHVPANGTTNNGKFLMAGATAGSLSWETPVTNSDTAVNLSGGYVDATTGSFSGDVTFSGSMKKNGGIIVPMYVQSTEPTAEVGESVLWLETRGNGRFSLWIKEG